MPTATVSIATTYMGPARIVDVRAKHVRLSLDITRDAPHPDDVDATLAIAFPYRPAVGDTVLAIRQAEGGQAYVIGVIEGCGPTTMRVPGDLRIEAPRGSISMLADGEITATSEAHTIRTKRLTIAASVLKERLGDAWRFVRGVLQLRARRERHVVEETYTMRAETINARAKGDVRIDGKEINLG